MNGHPPLAWRLVGCCPRPLAEPRLRAMGWLGMSWRHCLATGLVCGRCGPEVVCYGVCEREALDLAAEADAMVDEEAER